MERSRSRSRDRREGRGDRESRKRHRSRERHHKDRRSEKDAGHSRRDKGEKHRKDKKQRKEKKERHEKKDEACIEYGAPPLSMDDYFRHNKEFRVWLKLQHDVVMDDLDTSKAEEWFGKFIRAWNKGKLAKEFYTGLPEEVEQGVERTRYHWGFVDKMSGDEKAELERVKDSVFAKDLELPSKPVDPRDAEDDKRAKKRRRREREGDGE